MQRTHEMKLNPAPFAMIQDGKKTIELRLYDEKRQLISAGDRIEFENTEDAEQKILARVVKLHIFDSFDALYKVLPLTQCGYAEEELSAASPRDMEAYYSKEKQAKYGVVGIEIALL